jgi:hypothetical protein
MSGQASWQWCANCASAVSTGFGYLLESIHQRLPQVLLAA